jgi:cell pole-organizing protein PopZ
MSEPVSNAEIEDVLSSIRRLVSENTHAIRRDETQSDAGSEAAEKLVLTPDFRVDPASAFESERGKVVAASWAGAPAAGEEVPEAAFADLEDEEMEAQASDPASLGEGEEAFAGASVSLEQRIAELELAVDSAVGEFEPDGSEVAETVETIPFQPAGAVAEAEAPETEEVAGAEAPVSGPAMADEAQEWEDVAPAGDAAQGHEASGAYNEAEDAGMAMPFVDDDDETDVIDEDTLHEMVVRMVREELQGTVGERITHNVRRMVRREIAKALALRDFE